jgi:hypothetical protein
VDGIYCKKIIKKKVKTIRSIFTRYFLKNDSGLSFLFFGHFKLVISWVLLNIITGIIISAVNKYSPKNDDHDENEEDDKFQMTKDMNHYFSRMEERFNNMEINNKERMNNLELKLLDEIKKLKQ